MQSLLTGMCVCVCATNDNASVYGTYFVECGTWQEGRHYTVQRLVASLPACQSACQPACLPVSAWLPAQV
jgi:hypothetical protein